MATLNKVQLIGRLGQDPEMRTTPSGASVVNISLATSEYSKDQSGNRQERTEWHRVVFWNKLAEVVGQYCHKGSQIYVEGSLQTREWQDKDGNRRFSTDIVGRNLQLLDSKPQGQQQSEGQQRPHNQNPPQHQQPHSYQDQQPSQGHQSTPGNAYARGRATGMSHQVPPPVDEPFMEDDVPF
jgi:single-strand DNA-binding protein